VLVFVDESYRKSEEPNAKSTFGAVLIQEEKYRELDTKLYNFMLRHRWGKAYQNVMPTPFFCDSDVSPGIQVADVLAYCVNERYVGRRSHLEDYFKDFRDLTFNYQSPDENLNFWGFQMIPPEPSPLLSTEGAAQKQK
jgi:hypothetical protein